ncbi:hypothetical protein M2284_004494 [Rhodococcus sp. LBL1]|nr:hypothetical protein [Rhodococcus sp. LBL1]MDH6685697.1 hypothetical protein [Rhodococcus sp. LBL2]
MGRLIAIVAAVLLAVGVPATSAAAPTVPSAAFAGAGIGIGLTDAPGQAYIIENPQPGKVITRHVRVYNNTGAAQTVSVYAGPASMENGVFTEDGVGETNALTSWTTVDKPTLPLSNGQAADVVVTITVPPDAPSAQLYGVLYAGIDGSRIGVRMYVTVGGDNGPAADFTLTGLVPERRSDGTATLLATVTNTGGRKIDLTGTLRLTDGPGGKFVNAVHAQPTSLAAGATGTVLFVIPDSASLPAGPWTAHARLKNGYFAHELSEQITFPEKPSNPTSSLGSLGSLGSGSLGSLGGS